MKIIESAKRHPYRTGTATALVLGLVAAEIVGYTQNSNYDVPEDACISPPAMSKIYVEPDTNTVFQTYTGLFTTGVVARGTVPKGAYGIQASFKSPEADAAEWDKNASGMIEANDVGGFALKMAIGSGEVQFGVRTIAPAGSALCHEAPVTTYEHLDRGSYFSTHEQLPWRNPVADVTNLF
ncbi:MAG TPA: hypothetical protein VLG11_04865 [Candidatus Saccharimonadales bacterium]|nr:hypothetical protein [Candidatus Saccharimonadales bacterium]